MLLYGLLVLYGLVLAYVLISPWNQLSSEQLASITEVYMGTRLERLSSAVSSLQKNGYVVLADIKSDHTATFYLYAAYLGVMAGKTEAWQIFLLIQMGAAAVLLAAYPSMIYRLTDSLVAAVCSPVIVGAFAGRILYEIKTDIMYGLAWVIVMCLPLLGIYCREKKGPAKWAAFVLVCIFMGIGNLWRAQGPLPILLLLATAVIFEQAVKWKQCTKDYRGGVLHRARA